MKHTVQDPCETCTYHGIISADPSQIGCSADKTEETCPKLRVYVALFRRILKHERKGTFKGYKKQVFGEPVLEP